ncbi:hypothetical protein Tco_0152994 [Tanacetum coccineum]
MAIIQLILKKDVVLNEKALTRFGESDLCIEESPPASLFQRSGQSIEVDSRNILLDIVNATGKKLVVLKMSTISERWARYISAHLVLVDVEWNIFVLHRILQRVFNKEDKHSRNNV